MPQVPPWQVSPVSHVVPHVPQLASSVSVLVQDVPQQSGVVPLAGQKPAPQVTPQIPLWHVSLAAQMVAQEPQCAVSVVVSTQIVPQQVSSVPHEHWIVPPQPSAMEPQNPAGQVPPGATIVCTVTGHGLKDPGWALKTADGAEVVPTRIPVDAVSAARALGLER